jgi:hypothetical protein
VYRHFFFSEGCACDICDEPRLPFPWLGSHGDYSPTAPAAPSLRPLILRGSLIRCEPVKLYHHRLCSGAVLLTSLLSFRRGPTPPQYPVTFCNPVEDLTVRFSISSSTVFLKILSNILFFLRCSCNLAPRSFSPLLHSVHVYCLLSSIHPLGSPLATSSLPGSWWQCPSCNAGMAQRVIHLRAMPNFFWDMQLPSPFLQLLAAPYGQKLVPISVLQCSDSFHCGLFLRDCVMLRYSVPLLAPQFLL